MMRRLTETINSRKETGDEQELCIKKYFFVFIIDFMIPAFFFFKSKQRRMICVKLRSESCK